MMQLFENYPNNFTTTNTRYSRWEHWHVEDCHVIPPVTRFQADDLDD